MRTRLVLLLLALLAPVLVAAPTAGGLMSPAWASMLRR